MKMCCGNRRELLGFRRLHLIADEQTSNLTFLIPQLDKPSKNGDDTTDAEVIPEKCPVQVERGFAGKNFDHQVKLRRETTFV